MALAGISNYGSSYSTNQGINSTNSQVYLSHLYILGLT